MKKIISILLICVSILSVESIQADEPEFLIKEIKPINIAFVDTIKHIIESNTECFEYGNVLKAVFVNRKDAMHDLMVVFLDYSFAISRNTAEGIESLTTYINNFYGCFFIEIDGKYYLFTLKNSERLQKDNFIFTGKSIDVSKWFIQKRPLSTITTSFGLNFFDWGLIKYKINCNIKSCGMIEEPVDSQNSSN